MLIFGPTWVFLGGHAALKKFTCLRCCLFGLASACYVFTKLLRPLVKRWRGKGIQTIVYIDDGIGASKTKALNEAHRNVVVSNLTQAGFVLNIPKS